MKKFITILFLLTSISLFAQNANYYVDNTGTGDTLSTIAELNDVVFQADDSVFLKKGCVWRGTDTITGSGTAGHYVVFTSYGTGDNPKMLGSNITTWTACGGNVYKSAGTFLNPFNLDAETAEIEVFFEELDDSVKWGVHQADTASLTAEYHWTWVLNYIYVYAPEDPDTRYTSVQIPQTRQCVYLNQKQYLEFNGIDFHYSLQGLREFYPTQNYTGLIIRNCNFSYMGRKDYEGTSVAAGYNNTLFEYNVVHDMGRRGASLRNYGDYDISIIVVQYNTFYNGYHTTGADITAGTSGEADGDLDSVIVRNNLIYDIENRTGQASEWVWLQSRQEGTGILSKVYVYNNIMMYSSLHGIGIEEVDDVYIYNNTFYGHNSTITANTFHIDVNQSSTNVNIKNNIFYPLRAIGTNATGTLLYETSFQDHTQIHADYNIYYRIGNWPYVVISGNGTEYHMDDIALVRANLGWEAHGQFIDPDFINVTSPVETDSLMIDAISPAKDVGIAVGVNTDYRDSIRDATPDIGAYEQGAISGDPPDPPDLPTVTTTTPTVVYSRLAQGGGNVTSAGGGTVSVKGICWSISVNPSTLDSKTTNGAGIGAFTDYISSIAAGTTYHVRAYATNETGTSYGSNLTFTTPAKSYVKTGGKYLKYNGKICILH